MSPGPGRRWSFEVPGDLPSLPGHPAPPAQMPAGTPLADELLLTRAPAYLHALARAASLPPKCFEYREDGEFWNGMRGLSPEDREHRLLQRRGSLNAAMDTLVAALIAQYRYERTTLVLAARCGRPSLTS